MNYYVLIYDEVYYDIEKAIVYYDLRSSGLGDRFYKEFQETVKIISHSPFSYQIRRKNYRELKMKIFPFSLIYEVGDGKIHINRLFHLKRNPRKKYKK
jgi:toxin ParE1/3/4